MKKYYLLFAYTLIVMGFAACSKDNDEVEPPVDYVETKPVSKFDQLKFFQNNLVEIDSDGNFVQRICGVPLDPADETVISIGVESISEAKEIFKGWLSPDAKIAENEGMITFLPVDEEGKAQGKITFSASSGDDIKLAEVSFSSETKIKLVTKVVFIKSSAWPNNGVSAYSLGDKTVLPTIDEGMQPWVCIREAGQGTYGILLRISNNAGSGYVAARWNKDFISVAAAKDVSKILLSNWGVYKAYIKDASMLLNDDNEFFWTNESWKNFWVQGAYAICLQTGYIHDFQDTFYNPQKRHLQAMYFGETN